MRRRLAWTQRLAALIIAVLVADRCHAALAPQTDSTPLVEIASSKFPNLTRAERALLENADIDNVSRTAYAVAGTTADAADPSNDPAHAETWDPQRNVRARLIEWMTGAPDAIRMIHPRGIALLGARIVGNLDLTAIKVPFAIALRTCKVTQPIDLTAADVPLVDLQGSYTVSIHANSLRVASGVNLNGIHLEGIADFTESTIGSFSAIDGHFKFVLEPNWAASSRGVLIFLGASIRGGVYLTDGFDADGDVIASEARIGGDFTCTSAHFFNPGNVAIELSGSIISGGIYWGSAESAKSAAVSAVYSGSSALHGGPFRVTGQARLRGAQIGAAFVVWDAVFSGFGGTLKGLEAPGMVVKGAFIWRDVRMDNGAQLVLSGASVQILWDDSRSWPSQGNLIIDGFSYTLIVSESFPDETSLRLRWLSLQPPGYHPQPYRQLAKVLRELGDDAGAVKVQIASGDARYSPYGIVGRSMGWLLKVTIGYGHRPLLAILWSSLVVAVGWLVTRVAKSARVMRRTYPENAPTVTDADYERLYPMLFSLDVFLPFVNLHQEHYWWPSASRAGEVAIRGWRMRIRGDWVLYYLWVQIIAGWLLSAIFIAGVTGLLRND